MEEKPERKKKKAEETSKEPNVESKSKLLLALKEEVIKLKKLERIDTEEIEKTNAKLKQEIEEREKLSLWVKEKLRPGLATFKEEVRSEISAFKSESQKAQNQNNSGVSKEEFFQMMKEMKVLKDQIESMNQEMIKLKNINNNLINKINSMSGTNSAGSISNSDNKPPQVTSSNAKQQSPQQRPPQQSVTKNANTTSTSSNVPNTHTNIDTSNSASNTIHNSTNSNSNINANIVPGELANKAPASVSVVTNTKQPPRNVRDWLIMIGYDRYITHFMERGIDTLGKASHVNDQTLIKMGITLKRHRLDLLESIQALRSRLIAESQEQAKKQKEAEQTINSNSNTNTNTNTNTNNIEEQQENKPKITRQIIEDDHKAYSSSGANANEVSNPSAINEEKVKTKIQETLIEESTNETETNEEEEKEESDEEPSEKVLSRDEKMMLIREEEAKKALEKYEREKAKRELEKQKQAAEENKIKKQNEEKDLLRLKKRRDQIESSNDSSVSSSKNSNINNAKVKQKNTNTENLSTEKSNNNNNNNNSSNNNSSSNSSGNNNSNVKKAILAVHGDGPTTWLWCEYGDEGLNLVGSGEGGCDSFGSEIDSNKVLYGLLCVDDGGRDQFVFVLFIGSKVNFQAKANANKRKSEVAELFKPFDVQIKAEDSSDLSYDKIMTTLRASR